MRLIHLNAYLSCLYLLINCKLDKDEYTLIQNYHRCSYIKKVSFIIDGDYFDNVNKLIVQMFKLIN